MDKKIAIVGSGFTGSDVHAQIASRLEKENIQVVCVDELKDVKAKPIEEICQPEPYIIRASPLVHELFIYDPNGTSKGDLKRCKKGIHNRIDGKCIHCKREV